LTPRYKNTDTSSHPHKQLSHKNSGKSSSTLQTKPYTLNPKPGTRTPANKQPHAQPTPGKAPALRERTTPPPPPSYGRPHHHIHLNSTRRRPYSREHCRGGGGKWGKGGGGGEGWGLFGDGVAWARDCFSSALRLD
jgi:hypothetical protein